MEAPQSHELTALLRAWSAGNEESLARLTPLVYHELHRAARRYMVGERSGHTLQATALINEVYLRLIDVKAIDWQNRAHFFAVSARAMRQILVDYARAYQRQKRGSGAHKVELDEAAIVSREGTKEIVDVNEALQELGKLDARKAQVVELKYFGGLTYEEIAEVVKISVGTVRRDWEFAKAWLHKELTAMS